jgi:predicted extracellular nuclease
VSLRIRAIVTSVVCAFALGGVGVASGAPTDVFFSEYIEGSSNNKALEIFNGTGASIDLGAQDYFILMHFNGNPSVGLSIELTGTVAAGDVYVVTNAAAAQAIRDAADQITTSTSWFNGDDAVVLRKAGSTGTVVDSIGQVGFDPGTEWGSGLTSTADNTLRRKASIESGDANFGDTFDPAAEWDGFATDTFGGLGFHTAGGDAAPVVSATNPANGAAEVPEGSNVSITFSEDVSVSGSWYSISCPTSGDHAATESGGPRTFVLDPVSDFAEGETCTVRVFASQVRDLDTDDPPDTMPANHSFSFTTTLSVTQISEIQGAAHISPMNGRPVKTEGIVTVKRPSSFYLQDPTPDGDPATSEAILVFGSSAAAAVAVGDSVRVNGNVTEFRPGGAGGVDNLTVTEIVNPTATVLSEENSVPAPTVIGLGGRLPPTEVIDNGAPTGNVETSGVFDPAGEAIDFYESLESMLVQANRGAVVNETESFGEITLLPDNGEWATGTRTPRGGILYRYEDGNPERIAVDDEILRDQISPRPPRAMPAMNVGDRLTAPVVGPLDYTFENFKIQALANPVFVSGGLQPEVTRAMTDHEIAVATFNVENLDPSDGPAFGRLARQIVDNLRSPDLIAIEEVQDVSGASDTGVVDASVTWQMLIDAIAAEGGPSYEHRQIDPVNNEDGGAPGANIRVGFLFRTDRGLSFIDRPGGDATTPTTVIGTSSGPQLSFSPGRIDPDNPAFVDTRKSLAGEFRMRGRKVFVIANHLSSKGDDQGLVSRWQPPTRFSEEPNAAGEGGRHPQAQVVNDFVDAILAADRRANVIVLGDINDFEFSETIDILEGGVLTTLMDTLPVSERYSYVFEGNSQTLDQILLSDNLLDHFRAEYDVVHVNSEFAGQASDHEPSVARLDLRSRPSPK